MNEIQKRTIINRVGLIAIAIAIFVNVCMAIMIVPKPQQEEEKALIQIEEPIVPLSSIIEDKSENIKIEFVNQSGEYFVIIGMVGVILLVIGVRMYIQARKLQL